jgi:hypothetical protein
MGGGQGKAGIEILAYATGGAGAGGIAWTGGGIAWKRGGIALGGGIGAGGGGAGEGGGGDSPEPIGPGGETGELPAPHPANSSMVAADTIKKQTTPTKPTVRVFISNGTGVKLLKDWTLLTLAVDGSGSTLLNTLFLVAGVRCFEGCRRPCWRPMKTSRLPCLSRHSPTGDGGSYVKGSCPPWSRRL